MRETISVFILSALSVLYTIPSFSEAAMIQAGYEFFATDFLDSNGIAPPNLSPNQFGTEYIFTLDTTQAVQLGLTPDIVVATFITDSNGTVIVYDETNSGVNVVLDLIAQSGRVTIGGNLNGVATMAASTNDFRFVFDISLVDCEVISIVEGARHVTQPDPGYDASTNDAKLSGFFIVPTPSTLPMLVARGFLIGVYSRRPTLSQAI